MSYKIFTDTSSNLPTPTLRELGIEVIPFTYLVDGEAQSCLDTTAFDGEAYYNALRSGVRVTTAQIAPQTYMDAFSPVLEGGEDIIYVSMSSGISGSCNSARIAAGELKDLYPARTVRVVDTLAASLGEGIVVLRAAELRDSGVELIRAAEELDILSRRVCQIFTVDDLMHLRRGGRLSNIGAVVGTVLQIKPLLLGNEEGKIISIAKIRGKKHAVEALADKYDALVDAPQTQTVGIAHAGCREDADYLVSLLKRSNPPKDILVVDYEPMTGAHVGPGALALFFVGRDDVRSTR